MSEENKDDKISRKKFLKASGAAAAATGVLSCEFMNAEAARKGITKPGLRKELQAQCPYCGVGCGTLIQVEDDKIVGMVPDKDHPTNKGIQCIKGLMLTNQFIRIVLNTGLRLVLKLQMWYVICLLKRKL